MGDVQRVDVDADLHRQMKDFCRHHRIYVKQWVGRLIVRGLEHRILKPQDYRFVPIEQPPAPRAYSRPDNIQPVQRKNPEDLIDTKDDDAWSAPPFWRVDRESTTP